MNKVPVQTRRERRIAARREQILDAAAAVFSQRGYERATTREIAETADLIREGTLYNYFPSKKDLLIGVAKAYADEVTTAITDMQADSLEDMMAQFVTMRFSQSQERRLFLLFSSEARINPEVREHYVQAAIYRIIDESEKQIHKLVERGVMRAVDPAIAARTLGATIMGFGVLFELDRRLISGDTAVSPAKLGAQVSDILLNGLRNTPKKANE